MNEKSYKDNKELLIQHAYLDLSFLCGNYINQKQNVEYDCMAQDVQRIEK